MTTTHASATGAPKPVDNAPKPQQGPARNEADKAGNASDLFSAMLALMGERAAPADAPAELLDGREQPDADPAAPNPLAAMLAWMAPSQAAAADQAPNAASRQKEAATQTADGIDITGMTRVDEAAPATPHAADKARSAAASRAAFTPFNPHTPPATGATTQRADAGTGSPSNLVWQRANTGTDTLQQQNAAQLAQVRSTVALNDRFGTAGVPPELSAAPLSARDVTTLSGATGHGPASGPAATADTSVPGLLGAGTGSDAGAGTGSNGDPAADAHTGDGPSPHHTEAGAEAQGATVSHWGTQHLRHASLRVGEGGADAIDIQLQLKGQEVQVAFQTDNLETRAHLRESAGESLADLMQRGGIQLGSVSVGSQGPSHGDSSPPQVATATMERPTQRPPSSAQDSPRAAVQHTRADGSRSLDVFA